MVGYVSAPTERKGMLSDIGWLPLPATRDGDRNVHGGAARDDTALGTTTTAVRTAAGVPTTKCQRALR